MERHHLRPQDAAIRETDLPEREQLARLAHGGEPKLKDAAVCAKCEIGCWGDGIVCRFSSQGQAQAQGHDLAQAQDLTLEARAGQLSKTT